jgi:hypothetical protein
MRERKGNLFHWRKFLVYNPDSASTNTGDISVSSKVCDQFYFFQSCIFPCPVFRNIRMYYFREH